MLAENAIQATAFALPGIGHAHRRSRAAPETPAAFAPSQPHRVAFFQPNQEIYGQGEQATALYQVEVGAVRIYRLDVD